MMLVIALAIKLDSRGPVFFVQQRTGLYRMPFNLIKFRTMHPVVGRHSGVGARQLDPDHAVRVSGSGASAWTSCPS